jgi:hypothetical protein
MIFKFNIFLLLKFLLNDLKFIVNSSIKRIFVLILLSACIRMLLILILNVFNDYYISKFVIIIQNKMIITWVIFGLNINISSLEIYI